jgi:DNA replication protein DnaC
MDNYASAMRTVEMGLSFLKPINLSCLLADLFTKGSVKEAFSVFCRIFELYGFYWTLNMDVLKYIKDSLFAAILRLPSVVVGLKDAIVALIQRHKPSSKGISSPLLNQANEEPVEEIEIFGYKVPKGTTTLTISIVAIAASIAAILGGIAFTATSDFGKTIAKAVSAAGNATRGLTSLAGGFTSLKQHVMSTLSQIVGINLDDDTPKGKIIARVAELTRLLEAAHNQIKSCPSEALDDSSFIKNIETYIKETETLYTTIAKTDTSLTNLGASISQLKFQYIELKKTYKRLVSTIVGKQVPATLWLYGESGVGKSMLVKEIIRILSANTGRELLTYVRSASDPFWSGYSGQDVVVYDDFSATNDGLDHDELDKIYTGNSFIPRMADVADKGDIRFISKYLIICSNFPYIEKSAKLASPSILDRRRDFVVEVKDPKLALARGKGKDLPSSHYKPHFAHLTYVRKTKYRSTSSALPDYDTQDLDSVHKLAEALYRVQAERAVDYADEVLNKLEAFRSGMALTNIDEIQDELAATMRAKIIAENEQADPLPPLEDPIQPHFVYDVQGQFWRDVHDQPPASSAPATANVQGLAKTMALRRHDVPMMARGVDFQDTPQHIIDARRNFNLTFDPQEKRHLLNIIEEWEQSVDLNNQSVDEFARSNIILLLGTPGTGKTQLSKRSGVFTLDDFPLNDDLMREAVELVWNRYDNVGPTVVLTANPTTLSAQFRKLWPNDPDKIAAFMRRCKVFNFAFRRNWIRRFTAADLAKLPYESVVSITYKGTDVSELVVMDEIKLKHTVDKVQILDELTPLRILAPNHYKLDYTLEDVVNLKVTLAQMISGVHIVRGTLAKFLPLATQFVHMFSRAYGTPENAFRAVNSMRLTGLTEPISIELGEVEVVFYPSEQGHIQVGFNEHIDLSSNDLDKILETVTDIWYDADNQTPEVRAVGFWFDVIAFFLKLGTGIAAVYAHASTGSGLSNEVDWGDSDLPDDFVPYQSKPTSYKKLPKSVIFQEGTKAGLEYCPTHHIYDKCFTYEATQIPRPPVAMRPSTLRTYGNEGPNAYSPELKYEFSISETPKTSGSTTYLNTTAGDLPRHIYAYPGYESECGTRPTMSAIVQPLIPPKPEGLQPEAVNDPAALEYLRIVADNTLFLKSESGVMLCRAIMIKGHYGITNAHAVKGHELILSVGIDCVEYKAHVTHRDVRRDIVVFRLVNTSPQYRDITGYMLRKTDTKDLTGHTALMQIVSKKGTSVTSVQRVVYLDAAVERQVDGVNRYGVTYQGHSNGYTYDPICTHYGDCGSAIVLLNSNTQRKLVAFHGAANTSTGFGNLLFQEDFLFSESVEADLLVLPHQELMLYEEQIQMGHLMVIGDTIGPAGVNHQYRPVKTKFYKSPYAGFEDFDHLFEPAVLYNHDPRCTKSTSVYLEAMMKWSVPQPALDTDILDYAVKNIGAYLADVVFNAHILNRVLTKTEAINGISWIPGSNPIARNTSPGYPWCHKTTKKSVFFKFDEATNLQTINMEEQLGRRLNHAVDSLICAAKNQRRSAVTFLGCLKDEPLKLKKIYDVDGTGKHTATRSITAAPIDYTLAQRMYFHTASAALTTLHQFIPIKIGIDPLSTDWDALYYYHAKMSDHGFDGDFSAWDATVPKAFMERLPVIYNAIYQLNDPHWKPEDDIIRQHLHSVLHGPLITVYDRVVQCPGGQVTGQPMTALDNCLALFTLAIYNWIILARKNAPELANFKSYLDNVRGSFYGDDNMFTIKHEVTGWFNFNTFASACADIGFTLTNAAKDGSAPPLKPLKELEFLKRLFTPLNGKYIGRLVPASLNKMLAYCKANPGHHYYQRPQLVNFDRETIAATAECAMREAVLHGRPFFNRLALHLKKKTREWNLPPIFIPDYDDQVASILAGSRPPA